MKEDFEATFESDENITKEDILNVLNHTMSMAKLNLKEVGVHSPKYDYFSGRVNMLQTIFDTLDLRSEFKGKLK